MILDIIRPNSSKLATRVTIFSAVIIITGMISGLLLKANKTYIPISLISVGFLSLIVINLYRFYINKEYVIIGQLQINKDKITAKLEQEIIDIDYLCIQRLHFIYGSYVGEPSDYGLGIKRGNKNYLSIITDESSEEFEILLKSKSQKDIFMNKIKTIESITSEVKRSVNN